jgi:hypothetical protein
MIPDHHFYVPGLSTDSLDYIEEHHAHDVDDDGFPMIDVEAYFDDGDMLLGPDSNPDIEQSVYATMTTARDAGHLHVVFKN